MKLNKKQIITIIVVGLIILSVGFNLYTGFTKIKNNAYQKGLTDGVNSAVQQIKSGIKVDFTDGTIMFVPSQLIEK